MTISITHRRGDAFSKTLYMVDADGAALTLDPTDLVAQLYKADKTMLAELSIAAGDAAGYYVLAYSASTTAWPLEFLHTNIFDTSDDSSSDEFIVQVIEQISRVIEVPTP